MSELEQADWVQARDQAKASIRNGLILQQTGQAILKLALKKLKDYPDMPDGDS